MTPGQGRPLQVSATCIAVIAGVLGCTELNRKKNDRGAMSVEQKTRVLVIDDDPLILELVSTLLGTLECTVVGSALNGAEGLVLFTEERPDLVLLDFMMPGLSGLETLKKMLEIEPKATVVMLTAVENSAVSDDCILAGAQDFIRKDLPPNDLARRLSDLVNKIRIA